MPGTSRPAEAIETIRESIRSVRELLGTPEKEVRDGTALMATGYAFLKTWKEAGKRKRRPKARLSVLSRKAGLCQVPGCTNPAEHVHHRTYRSHQGGEEVTNLFAACDRHHRAIHAGLIRLWGLAGKRLVVEFRDPEDLKRVVEAWVTCGADDTRRL